MLSDTYVYTTAADVTAIDVRKLPANALVGALVWDRAGQRRVVPPSVRGNVLRTLRAGVTLLEAGMIPTIPDEWCRIGWDSCPPLAAWEWTPVSVAPLAHDAVYTPAK